MALPGERPEIISLNEIVYLLAQRVLPQGQEIDREGPMYRRMTEITREAGRRFTQFDGNPDHLNQVDFSYINEFVEFKQDIENISHWIQHHQTPGVYDFVHRQEAKRLLYRYHTELLSKFHETQRFLLEGGYGRDWQLIYGYEYDNTPPPRFNEWLNPADGNRLETIVWILDLIERLFGEAPKTWAFDIVENSAINTFAYFTEMTPQARQQANVDDFCDYIDAHRHYSKQWHFYEGLIRDKFTVIDKIVQIQPGILANQQHLQARRDQLSDRYDAVMNRYVAAVGFLTTEGLATYEQLSGSREVDTWPPLFASAMLTPEQEPVLEEDTEDEEEL